MSTRTGAVVVGYDGSADSDLALSWADGYAVEQGRPLGVLISEVDPAQILEVSSDWHVRRMAQVEADARDLLAGARSSDPTLEVVAHPPGPALVAASDRAAAVVVGARGHGVLSGVLLGSVSQHVAHHAACPVVVVRQSHHPDSDRVVVGVDGSTGSRKALEFAFDHAGRYAATVTAVHAWHHTSRGSQTLADEIDAAERVLAESLAGFAESHPDVKVVQEAIPVAPQRALADASDAASLVVVGSRGHGTLAGLLVGSVSQSVLHHARCPVAVVR